MNNCILKHDIPRLNHEELKTQNRTMKNNKSAKKKKLPKRSPVPTIFTGKIYHIFKEELRQVILNVFLKN
jgi:hypothetical protein